MLSFRVTEDESSDFSNGFGGDDASNSGDS
jgi:hypothetical protein